MNADIIAVTIIYNNYMITDYLIKKIIEQKQKVKALIVIDNSLEVDQVKVEELLKNKIRIYYIKSKYNIGASGGYSLGMKLAKDMDAEFIWLNDSDGYPEKYCLSTMLKNYDESIRIIVPRKYEPKRLELLEMDYSHKNKFGKLISSRKKNFSDATIATSSTGLLIHKNVVMEIGYYDYNNYFVGFEDIDYCLRLRKKKIHINISNDSIYYHPNLIDKHNLGFNLTNQLKHYLPFYLGSDFQQERFKRAVYSASFLYGKYFNAWEIFITFIYSAIRTIISKYCSEERIIKLYVKGIKEGRKERKCIYKKSISKNIIDYEITNNY